MFACIYCVVIFHFLCILYNECILFLLLFTLLSCSTRRHALLKNSCWQSSADSMINTCLHQFFPIEGTRAPDVPPLFPLLSRESEDLPCWKKRTETYVCRVFPGSKWVFGASKKICSSIYFYSCRSGCWVSDQQLAALSIRAPHSCVLIRQEEMLIKSSVSPTIITGWNLHPPL